MRLAKILSALLVCASLTGSIAALQSAAAASGTKPAGSASSPKTPPASAAEARKVTSVEGITEYVLPNGLHVLLFPDPTKSTITVNITYRVGSRNENYGETGMAHLLEHLMFKGSTRHPNVPQELTAHGARPNGTTWFDRTNYFETFQASDENLQWALDLEADRMVHSFIAKKDLDSEMTVVRNEFELGENDPGSILDERVLSTAYLWHNYGHSTIGARSDIERVPIERLQAFYRTYYQPDDAYLLVAGKFDEARTLASIVRAFGPIPRPKRVLQATYTQEPTQDGERSVTLRRVGDVQALSVAYHVPSGAHPDSAAVDLLAQILADTPSGRLHKALVETKKASSVSSQFLFLHDPGFLLLDAEVRQESSLDDALKTMLETIDGLAAHPVTAEELDRARAELLKNIDLTLNSADRVGLELSEWIGAGDWRLFFLDRDRVKKATLEDVQRVAREYLKPSNRTVGLFIPTPKPDRAEIPQTPDVAALLKDYKGEAGVQQGEAFDPSPGNIESRVHRSSVASGLKLVLLSKKTRGGTVVANMTLRFGDAQSLTGKSVVADLAADMLSRGSSEHTRQQIKDEFDKLKARVGISGGPTQVNVSIETVRENLPAVWKLVAEVLRKPAFPATELELLKEENLAAIEQEKSDPQAMGQNEYERHMSPYPKGDVRYTPTLEESATDYKAATLDQVRSFYGDFYGASRGEASVVGDFDEKEMAALLAELFGDWKSAKPFERVPRPYQAVAPINRALEAPDKANAFFLAGENLPLQDNDPDYPALVLGNYMLGGGFLNSRLTTRIRQKEGLSYGVGSRIQASPLEKNGSFLAYAIYAPQNEARLETAVREEIDRALKDGFAEQEVREAKSGYLQSRQVTRAQDGPLARTLAQDLYLDRTLAWDAEIEKKIAALTPAQIAEAMRRHIDPSQISIVKAGDFAKSGSAKTPSK
jgi:zinc protease